MPTRTEHAERADRVADLYLAGKTPAEISEEVGCSIQYVHKIRGKRKIPAHHPRILDKPDVRADIATRYRNGESVAEILTATGVPRTGIYSALRKEGVTLRSTTPTRTLEEAAADLIEKYLAGESLEDIADQYGFSSGGVRNVLLRHRVKLRSSARKVIVFTPEEQTHILAMRDSGASTLKIAKDMGRNERIVARFLRELGRNSRVCRPRVVGPGGYIMVRDDQGTLVLEHRQVMSAMLGRPLAKWETVHHIDGDKANNAPENLQLRQGNHGKGIRMTCRDCGSHNVGPAELH